MAKEPVRVLITHAGGKVAHDLAVGIARGWMLGLDQPVILHLLHSATAADVEAAEHLKWDVNVLMHMDGDYSPLVRVITATTDAKEACRSVVIAFMPRHLASPSLPWRLIGSTLSRYVVGPRPSSPQSEETHWLLKSLRHYQ